MKKVFPLLVSVAIVLLSISACKKETASPTDGAKYKATSSAFRVLWSDHVSWTRSVIVNIVDGAPGTTEAVNRLLQNQVDIGNAIKPYYGDAAGNALTDLLHNHIVVAADILTAAKNGNTAAMNTASAAWYANGDSIAVFLNTANPDNFPLVSWKSMMKMHLDYTLEEATARLNHDYAADVVAYDKVYAEMMIMSDMLSEGIAKQFPAQF
jgi:hypothetical protein